MATPERSSLSARPRAPIPVAAAVVLLWAMVAAMAWLVAVSAVMTSFRVSTRFSGSASALAYVEPLLFLAVAAATALAAVKVWTGRDWARRSVVIVCATVLVTALATRAGLTFGTGLAGTLVLAALLVLLVLPVSQRWCDESSDCHSPRIGEREEPPFLVVAQLVMLWAAVVFAVQTGTRAVLAEDGADWLGLLLVAAAVVHAALNIGMTRRRRWGWLGTVGLAAVYTLWLVAAAVAFGARGGPWAVPAALALVPAAFLWALLKPETRSWCRPVG
ncbi:hypothetical protein ACFQS3_18850 [Glycomyces mayteni]|uniref:Integral membrane protein n=1 Tax=Glycomyces mayteni TaxID=543887 RepID=A0ABW2DDT0_9ACTN|nr:hypothetical protein GCM10025732_02470 [Glycomyces mayteni]